MPWTHGNYPESMKNFEPRVRDKAVEIANALLKDGYEEGRAIAIATAQAKEWNENHPVHESADHNGTKNHNSKKRGNLHVVPHDGNWAIKAEGEEDPKQITETKTDAVKKAQKMASDANLSAIIHREDGTVETSHNYH